MTATALRKIMPLSTLLWLFVPAAAQFEVNPDHFDDPENVVENVVSQTTPRRIGIQARIDDQEKLLESYNAQLKAKSLEVEDALRDLTVNGNEAGQAEACWIHQLELENLKKALALQIGDARAQLASLQKELATAEERALISGKLGPEVRSAKMDVKRSLVKVLTASLPTVR